MYDHDLDLDDLLSDPLVRLVMASDGVDEDHIRKLARRVASRPMKDNGRPGSGFGDGGSSLRHTPSCRAAWRAASSAQPSA